MWTKTHFNLYCQIVTIVKLSPFQFIPQVRSLLQRWRSLLHHLSRSPTRSSGSSGAGCDHHLDFDDDEDGICCWNQSFGSSGAGRDDFWGGC